MCYSPRLHYITFMIQRLYDWYGKRVVRAVIVVLGILILAVIVLVSKSTSDTANTDESTSLPEVTLRSIQALQNVRGFSVTGIVRAVSEAKLQTEAGGQITTVRVETGDTVRAGAILATIENSSAQAGLLQAQGAYESALASSQKNDTSLTEAKVSVRNAYRDTFSTTDNVVRNVIDQHFTNPDEGIGGFRLNGSGNAVEFVTERRAIGAILTTWSQNLTSGNANLTEEEMLVEAETTLTRVSNFTTGITRIISDTDKNTSLTESERATYSTQLAGARTALDSALSTISRVRSTYEQAKLSGTTGTISQSSAQLKSALGALRSAEANYEKTIVRTPISGVVNALYLKQGDYVSLGMPVALVANNGSLEIITSLSEDDLKTIQVGDSVRINSTATGTIVNIAPAIDPQTGKIEVRISADDARSLTNGSTVAVTFMRNTDAVIASGKMIVPLSALKLLPSGPIAFGVIDNTLVGLPVTLGSILGETVEILEGLTPEREIIIDARGLNEGDRVTVTK